VRFEGESAHYCPNQSTCPPQLKARLEHFIHRKAMNIDGLGSETVELLFQKGLVKKPSDLFKLQAVDLSVLDRLGEKSANNIVDSIRVSRNVPFERVLFALGIRFVGETVAKRLVKAFPTMLALKQASFEELILVDEVGERIARSIVDYFASESNCAEIEALEQAGLQFESTQASMEPKSRMLEGKTVVISGTFNQNSREDYARIIGEHGGKNATSVSAKTSFILAGENMGPAKLQKAQSLGVALINEVQFLELLDAIPTADDSSEVFGQSLPVPVEVPTQLSELVMLPASNPKQKKLSGKSDDNHPVIPF
jgi:DNA ligase (NAD+)